MYGSIIFNALIFAFDALFMWHLKKDYTYLAWSWVLSLYISATYVILTSYKNPSVQRTLQPFSRTAFSDWNQFIGLGLPGTMTLS